MERRIEESPESLVINGTPNYGVFKSPLRNLNALDSNALGGAGMRWFRKLRLKEWVHYAVIHPQWYLGMVILDAKYTAQSFFFAYNRETRAITNYLLMKADRRVSLSANQWDGRCRFRQGRYRMEFHNHLDAGEHRISAEIAASRGQSAVGVDITMHEDLARIQPLVVNLPLGKDCMMYSHKVPCPVSGAVRIGDAEINLDPSRDIIIMDEHKALYPYKTWWRWTTFAGRDPQGRIIGLNLTHNIVPDPDQWNENAVWVDGKMSLLGPAEFTYDPRDRMKPWRIRDRSGRADLEFFPDGDNASLVNAGVVRTDYHQPFGRFRGTLIDDEGAKHEITDYYGVTETFDARF